MSDVKTLKSIDISSYTIISTGIGVLFAVLASIIGLIAIGILSSEAIGVMAYLIPTLIIGTLMASIYASFAEGYLYNWLAKRMNPITFELENGSEIKQISPVPTALIISIITTILVILTYAVSMFIVPLLLSSMIQTLMFSGQTVLAYSLYQITMIITQPSVIALLIVGSFIISFVFTLISIFIYNYLGKMGKGIVVDLSRENAMTTLNSINPVSLIIVCAVINLILNIITSIIMMITSGDVTSAVSNIISGLISGVIVGALFAVFYNFLAPKLGKLNVELVDN